MSVTRQKKEAIVHTLAENLGESGSIVLADFTGINVEEINELRREMRNAGVVFTIVKNTLLKRAFEETDVSSEEPVFDLMQGPTALAFSKDEVVPVKILKKFAKDHMGRPVIKGGFVSGESFDMERMLELADIPGREELLARMVGSLNSPLQGFVSVTSGMIRKLLFAVEAIKQSKKQ